MPLDQILKKHKKLPENYRKSLNNIMAKAIMLLQETTASPSDQTVQKLIHFTEQHLPNTSPPENNAIEQTIKDIKDIDGNIQDLRNKIKELLIKKANLVKSALAVICESKLNSTTKTLDPK